MLVLTTNCLVDGVLPDVSSWPGPVSFIVLPGSAVSPRVVQEASPDSFILEYLEPAGSVAEVLADVFSLPLQFNAEADYPLVYMDRWYGEEHLHDGLQTSPHALEADLTEDGQLSRLLLGDMILTSPLLPNVLGYLKNRRIDDAALLDLLSETFCWKRT